MSPCSQICDPPTPCTCFAASRARRFLSQGTPCSSTLPSPAVHARRAAPRPPGRARPLPEVGAMAERAVGCDAVLTESSRSRRNFYPGTRAGGPGPAKKFPGPGCRHVIAPRLARSSPSRSPPPRHTLRRALRARSRDPTQSARSAALLARVLAAATRFARPPPPFAMGRRRPRLPGTLPPNPSPPPQLVAAAPVARRPPRSRRPRRTPPRTPRRRRSSTSGPPRWRRACSSAARARANRSPYVGDVEILSGPNRGKVAVAHLPNLDAGGKCRPGARLVPPPARRRPRHPRPARHAQVRARVPAHPVRGGGAPEHFQIAPTRRPRRRVWLSAHPSLAKLVEALLLRGAFDDRLAEPVHPSGAPRSTDRGAAAIEPGSASARGFGADAGDGSSAGHAVGERGLPPGFPP